MKIDTSLSFSLFCLISLFVPSILEAQQPGLETVVDEIRGSVVQIEAVFSTGQTSTGTGFFVSKEGHVVTANHVVHAIGDALPKDIFIDMPITPVGVGGSAQASNFKGVRANVVDFDVAHDIALLAPEWNPFEGKDGIEIYSSPFVNRTPTKRGPAFLADSVMFRDGMQVFTSGFPLNSAVLITSSGIIASSTPVGAELTRNGFELLDQYQIDMRVNHGNSGGPLFSVRGEVIGVVVSTGLANVEFRSSLPKANVDVERDPYGIRMKVDKSSNPEYDLHPIYYNSGIAGAIPVRYVTTLLNKNKIAFNKK